MGYVAKDRVGQKSGDLEIVRRYGRTPDRQIVWLAICRRVRSDNSVCGNEVKIRTSRLGDQFTCVPCSYVMRKKRVTAYTWTLEMDRMITVIAQQRAGKRNSGLPSYARYAARIGRPKHAVTLRAKALGLTRVCEPPWTESELAVLKRLSWATPTTIHARMIAKGFKRTKVAITLQIKKLRLYSSRDWLTGRDLAEMIGLDSHIVTKWVKDGLLKAKIRELEGNGSGNSREKEYVFFPNEIRTFILAHSEQVDLRKVNQQWFFDIIKFGHQSI